MRFFPLCAPLLVKVALQSHFRYWSWKKWQKHDMKAPPFYRKVSRSYTGPFRAVSSLQQAQTPSCNMTTELVTNRWTLELWGPEVTEAENNANTSPYKYTRNQFKCRICAQLGDWKLLSYWTTNNFIHFAFKKYLYICILFSHIIVTSTSHLLPCGPCGSQCCCVRGCGLPWRTAGWWWSRPGPRWRGQCSTTAATPASSWRAETSAIALNWASGTRPNPPASVSVSAGVAHSYFTMSLSLSTKY